MNVLLGKIAEKSLNLNTSLINDLCLIRFVRFDGISFYQYVMPINVFYLLFNASCSPQVCPLTALKFAELSVKAGIPPGVINVLPGTGRECGQAVADHPLVRKLGFTGSTPIGHTIMRSAADSNLKKVSLELGGKSPLIIFDDFDLDR